MNRNARKLISVAVLTLGIAVAVYALVVRSSFDTRTAAMGDPVMNLGTILVTPKNAYPVIAPDAPRYALRTGHQGTSPRDRSTGSI